MKKLIIVLLFIAFCLLLAIPNLVSATQIASPSAVATKAPKEKSLLDDQIKILKEKIATKVAEISKNSKQVIAGHIQSVGEDGFTIQTDGKDIKALVDSQVTTYTNLIDKTKKITLNNLKKGDYVVLKGVMLNNEFSAEVVYVQLQYEFLSGQIKNIEKKGYYIEIVTTDQETVTIDIEKTTQQKIIDPKTLAINRAGFADYKIGDRIQCVIQKRTKDTSGASGVRTLIIPEEIGL